MCTEMCGRDWGQFLNVYTLIRRKLQVGVRGSSGISHQALWGVPRGSEELLSLKGLCQNPSFARKLSWSTLRCCKSVPSPLKFSGIKMCTVPVSEEQVGGGALGPHHLKQIGEIWSLGRG